jgi:hypothetical protein
LPYLRPDTPRPQRPSKFWTGAAAILIGVAVAVIIIPVVIFAILIGKELPRSSTLDRLLRALRR